MKKVKIAISLGDLNGISPQIALKAHKKIEKWCNPIYITNKKSFFQSAKLLDKKIPKNFKIINVGKSFKIRIGKNSSKSGKISFISFIKALKLTRKKKTKALVTLPINKKSWELAGINFKGHTDTLESIFNKKAIMMIGCDKLFGAFFTHHIPLKDVYKKIKLKKLKKFFLLFYKNIKQDKIAVLGLNPHAGDGGVMGKEEKIINQAIKESNLILKKEIFFGALVPDTAFTKQNRKNFTHFIAMYHDQGLIPLKALYFDKSINVSLNLPIIRTSPDHGTAFDIAYKKKNFSTKSYINAVKKATVRESHGEVF